MMDEWNMDFPPRFAPSGPVGGPGVAEDYDRLSVEEMAMQGRRAAAAAKILLTMMETPLDWSFYFLLWDNCMFHKEFSTFFTPAAAQAVMYQHWNEKPHRFGLFSESSKVRPQYFVYLMLAQMGDEKIAVTSQRPDLTALAAKGAGRISVLLVNYDPAASHDVISKVHFSHLTPGIRELRAYRIDDGHCWSNETLELDAIDERRVDVLPDFEYQFYCPADSVLLVTLDEPALLPG
jgi:hypothetical protein